MLDRDKLLWCLWEKLNDTNILLQKKYGKNVKKCKTGCKDSEIAYNNIKEVMRYAVGV